MCAEVKKRLYFLGGHTYVQHDDSEEQPEILKAYIREHGGEVPPYMPLPGVGVEFRLRSANGCRIVRWSGCGSLPQQVLDYVRKNGTMPPYDE